MLLPIKHSNKKLPLSFQMKMDFNEAKKILNLNPFYFKKDINNSFKLLKKTYGENQFIFMKIREAKKICDEISLINKIIN